MTDADSESWGIKVTRIEIKDIVPRRDIADAMGRQMKAEREKRAESLKPKARGGPTSPGAEGRKAPGG